MPVGSSPSFNAIVLNTSYAVLFSTMPSVISFSFCEPIKSVPLIVAWASLNLLVKSVTVKVPSSITKGFCILPCFNVSATEKVAVLVR